MELRSLAGLIHPQWRGESKCEACGADFTCGATLAGCWCGEVKLTDETRADLRAKYERCLCRNCLEAYSVTGNARESVVLDGS